MDIKTGIGRQARASLDALEILAVIVRQEKRMRAEIRIGLVHSPEEADHRAGEALTRQGFHHPILWKQMLVYIRQVGIGKHHIRIEARAVGKQNTSGMRRICVYPFYGRVKDEFHTSLV